MNGEKYRKPTNSLFRFLLVGALNTVVGLSMMFFLLNAVQLSYWTSTFIGNGVGACVSYLLNRTYTFNSNVTYQRGLPRFFTIIFACYFVAYFFSEKLAEWMSQFQFVSPSVEQNIAVLLGSVLYTISNYLGQKYFVFNNVKTA